MGLGRRIVNGRSLDPSPPAITTAFMEASLHLSESEANKLRSNEQKMKTAGLVAAPSKLYNNDWKSRKFARIPAPIHLANDAIASGTTYSCKMKGAGCGILRR